MSWNCFPKRVANALMLRFSKTAVEKQRRNKLQNPAETMVWINIAYAGHTGEDLVKRLLRKLKRYVKPNVILRINYKTKKFSNSCSTKDPTPKNLKSHVIYCFTCPGCGAEYVGKTDRCLIVLALMNTQLSIIQP